VDSRSGFWAYAPREVLVEPDLHLEATAGYSLRASSARERRPRTALTFVERSPTMAKSAMGAIEFSRVACGAPTY